MDPVMASDTFSINMYKKQTANTAKILLREASTLAQARGKKAYVHVVRLGLGVCRTFEEQDELFVEAWGDALMSITDRRHVSFIDFSYVNCNSVHGAKNNQKLPGTDVVIRFSKRNLHDKVPEDCICVCNYAWQGNSLPGSEFWVSKACSSGDSAASCSFLVAEIQKHFINPVVCGAAVRIVAEEGQLLNVSDILEVIQGEELNCHELKLPPPTKISKAHEQAENGFCTSEQQAIPEPDLESGDEDLGDTAETAFGLQGDAVTKTMGPADTAIENVSTNKGKSQKGIGRGRGRGDGGNSQHDDGPVGDRAQHDVGGRGGIGSAPFKRRQETRPGDAKRSSGALNKQDRPAGVQGPKDKQPGPSRDESSSPIPANVKDQEGNRSATKPDCNIPRGPSNGYDDGRVGGNQGRRDEKGRGRAGSGPWEKQETRPGDAQRSNGTLDQQDRSGGAQEPKGKQPSPQQDKNNSPNQANVKDQEGNWSEVKPDFKTPRGPSNGNNEGAGGDDRKIWNNQNSRNSGKPGGSTKANGYDWQDQPQSQAGGAGARQRPWSSNPRTDSNYVHKAPIDHQFENHARQTLHKRVTPITPVSLDGMPSNEAIASLGKSDLTVPSTTLDDVIEKSIKFWDKFPSETARLHVLKESGVDGRKLEDFVHSVYPIVHHTCLQLLWDFLEHKKRHGTNKEKNVYRDMDLIGFIDRLMKKRPMSFLGADDRYYLPQPTFKHGFGGFEAIGSEGETYPLVLADFLSYDEMRLSALLSMSSWSWFVNDGRRKNFGEKDPDHKYQNEGVIVGQVGARLRKEGVMEYVDCVVTHRQNRPENGFGGSNSSHINAVWGKFWGGDLPTYQDANACLQAQRGGVQEPPFEYFAVGKDNIFNITVYKKRIAITAEILLCEANTRARACGKKAYVHVVGLGLGVWRAFEEQDELFVEAWGDALRNITDLRHVAFVDFSFINCFNVHGTKNNEKFPGTDVVIRFSKRNLHDKVPEDCVLVCNYAWDGNSLPGNEFWMGKLCSTSNSAAACSSCVTEIHTHYINPVVCGAAVRIATKDGQLLDVSDYIKKMQGNSPDFSKLNHFGIKRPCSSGGTGKRPEPKQLQNSGYPQVQKTPVASAEQHATPALECAPHTNGACGSSESSWAHDVDQTNASVVPAKYIPMDILHPTIPGCMIPNPEYVKQQKELRKAKKQNQKKIQKEELIRYKTMFSCSSRAVREKQQAENSISTSTQAVRGSQAERQGGLALERDLNSIEETWQCRVRTSIRPHDDDQTNPPGGPAATVGAGAPRSAWRPGPPSFDHTLNNIELETPDVKGSIETLNEILKLLPKEIPHPRIPSCMIPNPEYVKQHKQLKKAMRMENKLKRRKKLE